MLILLDFLNGDVSVKDILVKKRGNSLHLLKKVDDFAKINNWNIL